MVDAFFLKKYDNMPEPKKEWIYTEHLVWLNIVVCGFFISILGIKLVYHSVRYAY